MFEGQKMEKRGILPEYDVKAGSTLYLDLIDPVWV